MLILTAFYESNTTHVSTQSAEPILTLKSEIESETRTRPVKCIDVESWCVIELVAVSYVKKESCLLAPRHHFAFVLIAADKYLCLSLLSKDEKVNAIAYVLVEIRYGKCWFFDFRCFCNVHLSGI